MRTLAIMDRCKLLFYASGVFISFFAYGFFEQKIYSEDSYGEQFKFSSSLVVVQCFTCFLVAKVGTLFHNHPENETPHKYYVFSAIFNFCAQMTSNFALLFIEYVVQVVGKSCKPIAVMIFGVLLARKSYTVQKYLFVLMIVLSVGVFLYNDDHKANASAKPLLGNFLVAVSLLSEGLLGATEDKMRIASRPTSLNFMLFMNLYSMLLGLPMLLVNYEALEFVKFCMRHHTVIIDILIITACGIVGQFFVTPMVLHFGPLPLSLVTTLRKFCTAVFSALIARKGLSEWQWAATVMIFTALILDVHFGGKKCGEEKETKDPIALNTLV